MLYLTEILGVPVCDCWRTKIGTVADLAVLLGTQPPRVAAILVRENKTRERCVIPFEEVTDLSSELVRLRIPQDALHSFHPDEGLLLLRKDLLDQQIIDV